MDLVTFSYDRSFVLDALRQGEIDYLEHVSEAAEADLFRHLIRRQVVQRLAETYPTPRKKGKKCRSGFTCPANSVSNSTAPRAITPSRAFCAAQA
jgi:hypothetical protein